MFIRVVTNLFLLRVVKKISWLEKNLKLFLKNYRILGKGILNIIFNHFLLFSYKSNYLLSIITLLFTYLYIYILLYIICHLKIKILFKMYSIFILSVEHSHYINIQ